MCNLESSDTNRNGWRADPYEQEPNYTYHLL